MIDNIPESDYVNNRMSAIEPHRERLRTLQAIRRKTREEGEEYNDLRDSLGVYLFEILYNDIQRMEEVIRATDGAEVDWMRQSGIQWVVPLSHGFNLQVMNEEVFFRLDETRLSNITEDYGTVRAVYERVQRRYRDWVSG